MGRVAQGRYSSDRRTEWNCAQLVSLCSPTVFTVHNYIESGMMSREERSLVVWDAGPNFQEAKKLRLVPQTFCVLPRFSLLRADPPKVSEAFAPRRLAIRAARCPGAVARRRTRADSSAASRSPRLALLEPPSPPLLLRLPPLAQGCRSSLRASRRATGRKRSRTSIPSRSRLSAPRSR
jgi:hypothetical protein